MATQGDGHAGYPPGPVEKQVLSTLADLAPLSPVHDALVQVAQACAQSVDQLAHLKSAQDGLAKASLIRELRATLELLVKGEADDSSAVDKLLARLGAPVPSPVRDKEN